MKLTQRVLMTYRNTVERPAEGTPYLKQILRSVMRNNVKI